MIPENGQTDRDSAGWKLAPGEYVEVQTPPSGTRLGLIEAVMTDKSGFWLAADGVEPRVYISLEEKGQSIQPAPIPGAVAERNGR